MYKCVLKCVYIFTCDYFRHFSVPRIPDITGLKTFEGQIIHSHYYRDPQNFSGKRVVCVGGGHSGADISLDISSCASKVGPLLCSVNADRPMAN